MKITGITFLVITSVILLLLTILASTGIGFAPIFYFMIAGQALFLLTVYKVLTDDYKTCKTFKDGYEDHTPGLDE
tara:strand:- start:522 stop:746 length:225 start_codon:yes stop_codon:yes gene_type:complete